MRPLYRAFWRCAMQDARLNRLLGHRDLAARWLSHCADARKDMVNA